MLDHQRVVLPRGRRRGKIEEGAAVEVAVAVLAWAYQLGAEQLENDGGSVSCYRIIARRVYYLEQLGSARYWAAGPP